MEAIALTRVTLFSMYYIPHYCSLSLGIKYKYENNVTYDNMSYKL